MSEELGMDLFEEEGLELNLDASPEDLGIEEDVQEEEVQEENTDESQDESEEENINDSSEDQDDSEKVAESEEDDQEGGDDNNSPNLYSSLASVLSEQGLLPSFDLDNNKIESIDDISAALRNEVDSSVKQRLVESLGEDGYDAIMNGVPLTQLAEYRSKQESLESITEEAIAADLELGKKVIYQDYINQGMSEQRAQKLLKRIIDSGDDAVLEDSKESLESLKAFEAKQLEQTKEQNLKLRQAQEKEQAELDKNLKSKIYNSDELIKGVKLTKAIKDKVYNSMTEIVGKNDTGVGENKLMKSRRENPLEFDTKLYYVYELTNGFTDFSKVVNTTKTSAIGSLEQALRKQRNPDSGSPSYLSDADSYFGTGDELVLD